ncbi:MAG: HNH endonuclease signature motif containing protein [Aeromicrobium sp.]|uniref:HNH endonuclease signature motif containing protein n=1 Tax=Aeromicrobium sp. TaxID=1871063 RepID=UPI00260C6194|nr:HNH endonuclease signature motif containing protein [Aeromicrobium sp.]MDF1705825.1 HNH endonuclease signature motif containing protein [Aeromicrobium sp.]
MDDVANYDSIAKIRADDGEPRPQLLAGVVRGLYATYASQITAGGAPVPHCFADDERKALKENYEVLKRAQFDGLRSAILQAAGGRCPFCHQAKANEIDHFLPKAIFGEYSVFSPNLLPICTTCNKKKSNRYKQGGVRRYVHPYFDALPSEAFLRVDLKIDPNISVQFEVHPPGSMPQATARRLSRQFDDLGLAERYADEALEEMMDRLGSLYDYFDTEHAPGVEKYLRTDARSAAARRGPNHWLVLTLTALADSPAFCDRGFMRLGPQPPT